MAGDKGKGKRSATQEHRGGEERAPKMRKVTQEEMGKRKGKLQIKERDKPTEVEKMRRLEEKGKKVGPSAGQGAAADSATRKSEEKVALYKMVVERNFDHLVVPDILMPLLPGGPAQFRELNQGLRMAVKTFKEHSARRLKEYEAKGYLEY